MFWFFFTILVLLFAYYGDETNAKGKNYIYARCGLILVLSYGSAFCGSAADRPGYEFFYNYELDVFSSQDIFDFLSMENTEMEIGFVAIAKLCRVIGLSSLAWVFLLSILTNTLIASTLFRFRGSVFIYFFFLFTGAYFPQVNFIRQMLAVSIVIYAFKFIECRQVRRYILFICCAYLIHKSAIIGLLLVPLCFKKCIDSKLFKYVLIGLWILSLLMARNLISINIPLDFLSESRYEHYSENSDTLGHGKAVFDWMYNLFVAIFFLFGKISKEKFVYLTCLVLGVAISNLSINMIFISRMGLYFSLFYCAFIPMLYYGTNFRSTIKSGNPQTLHYFFLLYYSQNLLTYISMGNSVVGTEIRSILNLF